MKRFTLVAALVVCFSTIVNAAPVKVEFLGYITERNSSSATIEYFGVSPGDKFRLDFTYDLDTFVDAGNNRDKITGEFAYSLFVGADSGFELNVTPDMPYRSSIRQYPSFINGGSHKEKQPDGTVNTSLSYSVYNLDLFALNGEVGQEIDGVSGVLNYRVYDYTTEESYRFHGRFTKGIILSNPSVAAVPTPGAMLLAGFGASIVGWFRKKRLIG
jgi:hypothetical protein